MVDDHEWSGDVTDSGFFGTEGGVGTDALDPAVAELVDELVANAPAGREGLLRVLLGVQQAFERVSWRVQELVADRFDLSPAQVAGVVSYYPKISAERRGRLKFDVCTGTACWLRGSDGLLQVLTSVAEARQRLPEEPPFVVNRERCVGICGLSPTLRAHDRARPTVTSHDVQDLLTDLLDGEFQPEDGG